MKKLKISTLLLFGSLFVMTACEKHCDVRLKNGSTDEIRILTKIPDSKGNLEEESNVLKVGEELSLGSCTDCASLDENEIEPEKMLVIVGANELELKTKPEILKFLNELRTQECGIKIFE